MIATRNVCMYIYIYINDFLDLTVAPIKTAFNIMSQVENDVHFIQKREATIWFIDNKAYVT